MAEKTDSEAVVREIKRRTLKQRKHYNLKHKGEESQPQLTLKPSIVSDQKVSGTF
jgi:hypothetical protein